MNDARTSTVSSDEKLMGAAAHFFGPLAALIIWGTQKDKSPFIKFHTLQALAFDLVTITSLGIFFFCAFGVVFVGMFGSILSMTYTSSPESEFRFLLPAVLFPVMITTCITPISLLITAVRLAASFSILSGRDFRYPLIGKWLENFLKNDITSSP